MPASITSNGRMGIFPRKQHEECFEGEGIEGGLSCANRDQKTTGTKPVAQLITRLAILHASLLAFKIAK